MTSYSSSPQPKNKTYDYVAEVVAHFIECGSDCQHLRKLKEDYGLATVCLAIDKYNDNLNK